jgi:hypothetical protein
MRIASSWLTLTALLPIMGCNPQVALTPPPAAAPAALIALSGASVMIGAGDITSCNSSASSATAALVDSVLRADSIAKVDDAAFTLGDNAYQSGTAAEFANCLTPTWGDPRKRIVKKLHPAPGNHEYYSSGAAPYYTYFGSAAGDPGKGYYSYDVGAWHVVALNSEMFASSLFTDAARKTQMDWLDADLKAHKTLCTLAYWHHPRFSSGWHGSDAAQVPVWQIFYDNGVDLVLTGHDHDYERFLPMTPAGVLDTTRGVTQIIAGTGGEAPRAFSTAIVPNSAARIAGRAGVLLLTLGKVEYRSAFLAVGGQIWDQSGGKCH